MGEAENNDGDHDGIRFGLPPLVEAIHDGKVTWKGISGVDFELLGYFLSCHLVIEHYMDEFLKAMYPKLGWDAAKPTFGQRVALLTNVGFPERFNSIPALKHMNSLRNKLSHRIDFEINAEALLPLAHYVQKACEGKIPPSEPKELLDRFTTLCCATFGGAISGAAHSTKHTRP
jgi:hypothetical protein